MGRVKEDDGVELEGGKKDMSGLVRDSGSRGMSRIGRRRLRVAPV